MSKYIGMHFVCIFHEFPPLFIIFHDVVVFFQEVEMCIRAPPRGPVGPPQFLILGKNTTEIMEN